MSRQTDPEIRRALLEEVRDRLRTLGFADRAELPLAVHSLASSASAAGLSDLVALLARLESQVAASEPGAVEAALRQVAAAIERSETGEDEDQAEEIRACFAAEAAELLGATLVQLERLERDPTEAEALSELYRVLHTFKGASAMVGLDQASRAAHMLEDMLQTVREGCRPLDRPLLDLQRAGASLLRAMVEEPEHAEDHRRALAALAGAHGALAVDPRPRSGTERRRRTDRRRDSPMVLRVSVEETRGLDLASRQARLAAASVGAASAALRAVCGDLGSIRAAVLRGEAARRGEPAESVGADLSAASAAIELAARGLDREAAALARSAEAARSCAERLRATPGSWLFERLVAVAEEAARKLDKPIAVELEGGGVEADRALAGRLLEPLAHLVRNAVVHGCEEQAQRVAMAKSPAGRIVLGVLDRGEQVTYFVEDDGPGIDLPRIRERLVRNGQLGPDEAARASEAEVLERIFLPGLSTRPRADELAGRGVGLDAVRAEVSRLGGKVSVSTRAGAGTRFELAVPRTPDRLAVLVVRSGPLRFGLPLASVRRLEPLPRQGAPGTRLLVEEGDLPLFHLSAILGLRRRAEARPLAVILESAEGLAALEVEGAGGLREVAVERFGGLLGSVAPYGGVGLDDQGELVLLLDEVGVVRSPAAARVSARAPRVLLADDSGTVRATVSRALVAAGYEVDLAADGLDAWQRLGSERFDVLLTDLEMPRLGGLELLARLRAEPRLSRLPVVVLTSRVSERARARAEELGVRAFVAKPAGGARLVREIEAALSIP